MKNNINVQITDTDATNDREKTTSFHLVDACDKEEKGADELSESKSS